MQAPRTLLPLLFAGAMGCSGTTEPLDAGAPDTGVEADAGVPDAGQATDGGVIADAGGPVACDPALSVMRAEAAVLPLDLYTVVAQGGTGAYRFELESNGSGAIINPLSGAYLSGDMQGTTDVVRVTDDGCEGQARVEIRVVRSLELRPSVVQAEPGAAWQFEVSGGSGEVRFRTVLAGSAGAVSEAGLYTAGANEGEDVVEVEDLLTGQTAEARVTVVAGTQLSAQPPMVMVGEGQSFGLSFTGGSGYADVIESPTAFELRDGQTIVGRAAGREVVTLRDRYTGQTTQLAVSVAGAQRFSTVPFGDGLFASKLLAPGDLNGDGLPDLVLAHPEADIGAVRDGAVFVYAGQGIGFAATPSQVISGGDRRDEFGRAIAAGDFDGDGRVDLAIGAPRADVAGTDIGSVSIHRGVANGFFETDPSQVLSGRIGGDLFGWAVVTCDFNADGYLDLAVGAYNAEDRDRTPIRYNQGGIMIFNGHDSGFSPEPSRVIWGDVPDGSGGWDGVSNMHHGIALAAGDIDGDGVCDLAAGSWEYDEPGNSNTGIALVYRGTSGDGTGPGGLETRPVLGWTSQDPADIGSRVGRNLEVADLDGDQRAEVIVSHYYFDAGSSDAHGAVRIFSGGAFGETIQSLAPIAPSDLDLEHDGSYDQFGFAVGVGDATGDGLPDLLVGSIADEAAGAPGDSGTIRVYAGRAGALPDPAEPTRVLAGGAAADRLGATFTVVGDLDGDMAPEIVGLSQYADRIGPDVGEPVLFYGNEEVPSVPLDMPSEPSGMQFGRTAAVVGDVDGDGFEDLLVGAPESAVGGMGRLAGEAYLYAGSANGFASDPSVVLSGVRRHSSYDRLGMCVSSAGDFDGDGRPDFAVVSRFEDQPSSLGSDYVLEPGCNGSRSDVGAVYVFRGGQGAVDTTPAFIIYGITPGDGLREVDGGFDYDGDGLDDLVIGSLDLDRSGVSNMGGFGLIRGRPVDPQGRTTVVCAPDFVFEGRAANDQLGYQVAAIGDVDGDGCDEVAAGAPFADPTTSNEGSVYVLFGWGGAGCPASPEMVVLNSGVRNAQAGRAVGGGGDIDGDGVPDLAVGLPAFAQNGNTVGAAAVVYGAYLAGLPREAAQDQSAPTYQLMFDASRPAAVVVGTTPGEELGRGVDFIDLGARVGTVLAAGSPSSDLSGVTRAGGAQLFLFGPQGLVGAPLGGFGGETSRPGGRLGELVRGGQLGGRPVLVVGGYDGTSVHLDGGSAYVFDLTLP